MNVEIDWQDTRKIGPPDEPGFYLLAWSDGSMEILEFDEDDLDGRVGYFFDVTHKLCATHWSYWPAEVHPNHDPSPETQEDVTRVG
ncbi:MAG: hypothetical protein R3282_06590, partial [Rhodothermales bacterium]|nr:hypothetical protein [Rhodothermales bacterium]